jgi:hypothetical protein
MYIFTTTTKGSSFIIGILHLENLRLENMRLVQLVGPPDQHPDPRLQRLAGPHRQAPGGQPAGCGHPFRG